jgi:nickel-dependent lactate racemase
MTLIGEVPPGLAAAAARIGDAATVLDEDQVTGFVREQLAGHPFDGRSVCVLVPDATRTCPLPLLMRAVHGALHGRVSRLTVLVALGTHAAMGEEALARHLGYPPGRLAETYPGTTVVNHEWWRPETFADLGTIPAARIAELSEGQMRLDVPVLLNRAVVEHDVALVVGPVLPHEVVGISGGNKYFFPGAGGQQIIDVSHWLGALITSAEIIGTTGITPVRALIDDGAALIPAEKLGLCVVTAEAAGGLHSVSFGDTRASWASAAQVCAATHVTYLGGCCRSCRRCTTRSGRPRRASTSWSRWSPTAAR